MRGFANNILIFFSFYYLWKNLINRNNNEIIPDLIKWTRGTFDEITNSNDWTTFCYTGFYGPAFYFGL